MHSLCSLHRWLGYTMLMFLLVGCNVVQRVEGSGVGEMESPSSPIAMTPAPREIVTNPTHPLPEAELPRAEQAEAPTTVPPTATPEPTRPATATATPAPSPTPAPRLYRLTSGGCCTQPFWAPDSSEVRFIDRPAADLPVGIWGVPVEQPDASPTLVSEEIGSYSRDGKFLIETGETVTVIRRLADGTRWEVPTRGDTPTLSPDGSRIAWDVRDRSLPWDQQVAEIWVATLDGSAPQQVLTLPRGGVRGWLSNDTLLLSGRDSLDEAEQRLFTLSLHDGTMIDLVRSDRMRGELLSPGGSWLVYYIAQSDDPTQNGLWLLRTDGSESRQLPAELFGAYQWRDDNHLIVVPFRPDATFHELWELNATTGQLRQLTDPTQLPFKIANGDWSVSPDGHYVAFVESRDHNIWVVGLN
ncbi:MAG: hypothetical protein M3220_00295 [Chloroflexota bacterium]|nr:hypothetical protein [Chloroflexota bacterium]